MIRTELFFDVNQLLAIWIEPLVDGDWLKIGVLTADWLLRKTTPQGLHHIKPSYYFRDLQILSVWSVQPPVILPTQMC